MKWPRVFRAFHPELPSAEVVAQRDLEEARRSLLVAQDGREYAEAMCAYHGARIERLRAFLGETRPPTLEDNYAAWMKKAQQGEWGASKTTIGGGSNEATAKL